MFFVCYSLFSDYCSLTCCWLCVRCVSLIVARCVCFFVVRCVWFVSGALRLLVVARCLLFGVWCRLLLCVAC